MLGFNVFLHTFPIDFNTADTHVISTDPRMTSERKTTEKMF